MKYTFYLYTTNSNPLRVLSYPIIREFIEHHTDAADAMNVWYTITQNSNWSNFHEMKGTFNSVDAVGNDLYVFNIRGNKYRIIARVFFNKPIVYIRFVGTHQEYDKVNLGDL